MEMQIVTALVDLVKQGGAMALWGISIYLTLQLLKVVVVWVCLIFIVKTCLAGIYRIMGVRLLIKKDSISLLSKEVSDQVSASLDNYNKQVSQILSDLEKQLSGLSKNSEKKEEKNIV